MTIVAMPPETTHVTATEHMVTALALLTTQVGTHCHCHP